MRQQTAYALLLVLFSTDRSLAQVIPDQSLNTLVTQSGSDFAITGGSQSGSNLFHSFASFSIPTGTSATFSTHPGIARIFSRVTGGDRSTLDGLLQSPVTLFLLNPNGILFGPNASLNLNGPLIATTATAVKFQDGTTFNTTDPTPLLSISTPIGLQLGPASAIQIDHSTLTLPALTLLSGNLTQTGGTIDTGGGPITLAAVQSSSLVSLTPEGQLGFTGVTDFGDILFSDRAYMKSNGDAGGAIALTGRNIRVTDYSIIESVTLGGSDGNPFTINASANLEITGVQPDGSEFSYVQTYTDPTSTGKSGDLFVTAPNILLDGTTLTSATISSGKAGNLSLNAQHLTLRQGAQIGTFTFASGDAGDLNATVTESIDIAGTYLTYLPAENLTRTFSSGLYTNQERGASGNGGNLTVKTNQLWIADGGRITAAIDPAALGGNAGDIFITARDILIDGVTVDEVGAYSGLLANVPAGTSGTSGLIKIQTDRLRLLNGGQLSVANLGSGNAGNLEITSGQLEIAGASADGLIPSRISATSASEFSAGSVYVKAGDVQLSDRATIVVSSLGTGNAGNLNLTADRLSLSNGQIQSNVRSGNQGNITLNIANLTLLRDRSQITTNATDNASGGNIKINSPLIIGLNNSDIIANAIQGRGGNIEITAQSILGLKYRLSPTPKSDITASSEFGLNGTVEIKDIGLDPNSGLNQLPTEPIDPSRQIAQDCRIQKSRFIRTGRGGLPNNPTAALSPESTWNDFRSSPLRTSAKMPPTPNLSEAIAWTQNPRTHQIELIAADALTSGQTTLTCAP
jgi:filamentous hemagglutinin family protein